MAVSKVIGEIMQCQICSIDTRRASYRQKYCPECAVKVEKDAAKRRLAESYKPKPKTIPCEQCGVAIHKTGKGHRFCADCSHERRLAKKRIRNAKARLESGQIPQGTQMECKMCGCEFTKDSPARIYCNGCVELKKRRLLDKRVSGLIRLELKHRKNRRSWREFVEFAPDELYSHLERQFQPGMSWSNMNQWDIDHIRPRAMFSFSSPDDDDFKACWALTNLRPLWSKENREKSDKRIFLI